MDGNQAIEAALRALGHADAEALEPAALGGVRQALADGERSLFDRAVELKRGFDDLHGRVLRSAAFAEASLGTAAFIHELRQCLSPLMGLSELLKESPASPHASEWLGEISHLARKVADLLDRHAALLKTESSEEEPCDVQSVVSEAKQYFTRLPPGVKLAVEVPADLPRALARRRQLLHALVNLLANARDAQKGRPGTIRIVARPAEERVEVIVADEGSGVDPAIRSHLFEPLFTTKREDGTGLGLFLSRELLRPHGELLLLDEAARPPGARTAFAIRLPSEGPARAAASQLAEALRAAPPPADPWSASKQRARERVAPLVAEERNNPVLIVEDEAPVRRMTRAVLESVANIKIYEAADAAFAFKLLEKLQVDFLVCDKNLPDQDGLEVIRKARAQHPDIDAMIFTGYSSPESAVEAIRVGATSYLSKPVREVKVLRESVASALSRQKLHRLAARHEATWRQVFDELLAEAPDSPRHALERARSQFEGREAPPRCAVALQVDLQQWISAADVEAVPIEGAGELGGIAGDVDLLVFPAEISPPLARELLAAARARPEPPHLVGVGRYEQTETAAAAIEGRTGVLIDRGIPLDQLLEKLRWSTERRRRETRAESLRALLRELGFAF